MSGGGRADGQLPIMSVACCCCCLLIMMLDPIKGNIFMLFFSTHQIMPITRPRMDGAAFYYFANISDQSRSVQFYCHYVRSMNHNNCTAFETREYLSVPLPADKIFRW